MSLTAVNVLYEIYGQTSFPFFCGAFTKTENGQGITIGA
jgi:hypothetical protein